MTPEIELLSQIIGKKTADERVALVVPLRKVFSPAILLEARKHGITIVTPGLLGEDATECYRACGMNFSSIYFYGIPRCCFAVEFMTTRHRLRPGEHGGIFFME